MLKYLAIFSGLIVIILILFGIVEQFQLPVLLDPATTMEQSRTWAGVTGVGLLILDIFIPVPSSVVMIAMGAIFGVPAGTLLSMAGSTGAAILGFSIGRYQTQRVSAFVTPEVHARTNSIFQHWGWMAILITRPIPVLAEAIIIVAGTTSISWSTMMTSTIAGVFPVALFYALLGANIVVPNYRFMIFGSLILLTILGWRQHSYINRTIKKA